MKGDRGGDRTSHDGEADFGSRSKGLGVVLHHALEPRRRLECRLRPVRVLGVDELRHLPVGRLESLRVRLEAEEQLVDGARVGGVTVGARDVAALVDRRLQ